MPTVKHPVIPNVTLDVSEDKLTEHLEQGWVLVPDGEPFEVVPPGAFTESLQGGPVEPVQGLAGFDAGELPTGLVTITNNIGEAEPVVKPRRRRR